MLFVLGMFIGSFVGIMITALCVAAKRGEE